ncbi:MAG: hypothetical protein A2046_10480, partial [Bacteroidetes bacterium GWA2_30_7]
LITPQFSIPAVGYSLFAEIFWFGSYVDYLDILVSTTDNQTTSFTASLTNLDTLDLLQDGWQSFELNLDAFTGQDIYIAFNEHVADNTAEGAFIGLDLVKIDFSTSAKEVVSKSDDISIYPNPTTGIINIRTTAKSNVYVYNILGDVVATFDNLSNISKIDLSNLSEGNYVIKVVTEKESVNKHITIVK